MKSSAYYDLKYNTLTSSERRMYILFLLFSHQIVSDYSLPDSSVHGILQNTGEYSLQEYWSGLPFPSPGNLPGPGIKPGSSALAGSFFTTEPPGKPDVY